MKLVPATSMPSGANLMHCNPRKARRNKRHRNRRRLQTAKAERTPTNGVNRPSGVKTAKAERTPTDIIKRPSGVIISRELYAYRVTALGFLFLLSCAIVWFIDIREHNRQMHAMHGNGSRLVERMFDQDIPKLKKGDADASAFMDWSLNLSAWCAINGSTAYIIGPLPREADRDASKQSDGVRYLCACLLDEDLRSAVASEAHGSGPRGFTYLKNEYLQGQAEQPILQGMLDRLAMKPGENPTAFKIKWRKVANALNPQPAERILAEKYMHAISRNTKGHYDACITAASSAADLNDFDALSNKLAQLCTLKNSRDQKLMEDEGATTAMQARLARLEQKFSEKKPHEKGNNAREKDGKAKSRPNKNGHTKFDKLCARCGYEGHMRKDCRKPVTKCPFSFKDGTTCGGDHCQKMCWYRDPSKARNPKIRELVEKRLADDKTSSASGHNAEVEDVMTFSGFTAQECEDDNEPLDIDREILGNEDLAYDEEPHFYPNYISGVGTHDCRLLLRAGWLIASYTKYLVDQRIQEIEVLRPDKMALEKAIVETNGPSGRDYLTTLLSLAEISQNGANNGPSLDLLIDLKAGIRVGTLDGDIDTGKILPTINAGWHLACVYYQYAQQQLPTPASEEVTLLLFNLCPSFYVRLMQGFADGLEIPEIEMTIQMRSHFLLEGLVSTYEMETEANVPGHHSIDKESFEHCRLNIPIPRERGQMAKRTTDTSEAYLLVDTGASNHIINDFDCVKPFLDLHQKRPIHIETGAGNVTVESVGPAGFIIKDDQGNERCIIRTVLYSPLFKENLFSPGKDFGAQGTTAHFDPVNTLTLKDGTKIPIQKHQNCFRLGYRPPPPGCAQTAQALASFAQEDTTDVSLDKDGILRINGPPPKLLPVDKHMWHRRLAHATFGALEEIQKQSVGIKCHIKTGADDQHHCHICPLSGMKAAPHRQNPKQKGERVEKYGDCIFMDLAGPLVPSYQDGARYLSLFVDQKTLHLGGYPIRYKSEQTYIHRKYVADHADIGAMNIRQFHSDNGGEFTGTEYIEQIRDSGAKKTTIVARAPNMNGVAEAAFWRIFTAVRAMLLDSGLPKYHWAAAARQAIWIFNRTPKRGNQPSPYEILRGRKPDLTPIRIFGCLMHSLIDKTERGSKLSAIARTGFHCGVAQAQRGWLMYIPGQDKYLVTRNARFDEHILFHQVQQVPGTIPESPEDDEEEGDQRLPPPPPANNVRCRTVLPGGSQCGLRHFHLGHCQESDARFQVPTDARPSASLRPRNSAPDTPIPPSPSPEEHVDSTPDSPTSGVGQMAKSAGVETTPNKELDRLTDEIRAAELYEDTQDPVHFGYVAATKQIKDSSGNIVLVDIPKSHKEVLTHPDRKEWKKAMDEEYNSHMKNGTWKLVPAGEAKGRRIVGSTWAYDVKRNADGSINRYKARFCAQGFSQIEGLDYHITYSNTVRYETFRLLLAIAVAKGYKVTGADIKTAYLYGMLKEIIYMRQAKGYEITSDDGSPMLCQLIRSIYGLKQSGVCWETRLRDELHKIGFESCTADQCIYRIHDKDDPSKEMFMLVYVDDLCMATSSDKYRSEIWTKISAAFELKDTGPLTWILGTNVHAHESCIKLSQELYIEDLSRTFLKDEKMGKIPSIPCDDEILGLSPAAEGENLHPLYRSAIGKLGWLTVMTRPDIAYATSVLARFNNSATQLHMNLVIKLIKYLYKTKHYKITFTREPPSDLYNLIEANSIFKCDYAPKLLAFSDSSHGGEKPMCGFVILYNGTPILWHAGRLKHTSLSSAEGEYIVATQATVAVKALNDVQEFLRIKSTGTTILFCDNKAAVLLSDSNTSSKRLKHIATRIAFLREAIADKIVMMHHISTHGQIADIFTKPLGGNTFHGLRQLLLSGVG